jgi:hypothetical protein
MLCLLSRNFTKRSPETRPVALVRLLVLPLATNGNNSLKKVPEILLNLPGTKQTSGCRQGCEQQYDIHTTHSVQGICVCKPEKEEEEEASCVMDHLCLARVANMVE